MMCMRELDDFGKKVSLLLLTLHAVTAQSWPKKRTANTILALIGVDGKRGGGGVRNLLFYSSLTEGQTKHESFSQMRDAFFAESGKFSTPSSSSQVRGSFKKTRRERAEGPLLPLMELPLSPARPTSTHSESACVRTSCQL